MIDVQSHDAVHHYSYSNNPGEPRKLVITLNDGVSEFSQVAQELEQRLKTGNWVYRETKDRFGDTRLVYTPRREGEDVSAKTPTLNTSPA